MKWTDERRTKLPAQFLVNLPHGIRTSGELSLHTASLHLPCFSIRIHP